MPNVWENDAIYTHYKVSTVSGIPLLTSGTTSVTGTVEVTLASGSVVNTKVGGDTGTDAFGRLKVSNPITLFDSQHHYQQSNNWSTTSGGSASIAYQANESAVDMTVTTSSGDFVNRETKKVFPYQPGKSLLVFKSFAFAPGQANLRQRVGYFTTNNGVYLEKEELTNYMVLRSYVTGSVVNTRIAQSAWNGDKADGTGSSGFNLNTSKGNLFWCDLEWLGVGDVRMGFVYEGKLIVCHTFKNINENSTTYMTTAVLPVRQEITATDTLASTATAKDICTTVISEGGYHSAGQVYSADIGTTVKNLANAGVSYPVISLKLNGSRLDSVVVPKNIEGIVLSNNQVKWSLVLNPTLSGSSFSAHSNGTVDVDTTATGMSGGTQLACGYLTSRGSIQVSGPNDFTYQLGRTIGGTSDTLTLVASPVSNNTDVLFSVQWIEMN